MIYQNLIEAFSKKNQISIETSIELHKKLEFFFLKVVKSPIPLSPTKELDEVWHHFLLNTKQYEQYCL